MIADIMQAAQPVKVKICGITQPEQAIQIAQAGADAIGMVFAKSPRQIDFDVGLKIVKSLPPFVQTIAVFVNPSEHEVEKAINKCGIDMIQLHGTESPDFCKKFANRVIKAWRVKGIEDINLLKSYETTVRGFLLDTWVKDQMGGTGKTFDWSFAKEAVNQLSKSVILAGGLTPENVGDAVKLVKPWGVDASSSLEIEPGLKDINKVKVFIESAKAIKF